MKKWNKSLIAVATVLCLGASGLTLTASAAQPNKEVAPQYSDEACPVSHGPHKFSKKHFKLDPEQWKEMVEKRNADLYSKLKLSANQESAWKAYTESSLKNIPPAKPKSPEDFEKLTAPERLQKVLDLMKEKQARMEAHLQAVKTFYATLTPEQQKIFDAESMPKPFRNKGKALWKQNERK